MTHFKTFAGIICDSGAASMSDCQVFVDEGMTNPKSKYHSMDKRIKITISKKNKIAIQCMELYCSKNSDKNLSKQYLLHQQENCCFK